MTPRPLETFQLANLVAEVSHDLATVRESLD